MRAADIKEILMDLSPNDWLDGPEADHGGYQGMIFKFRSSYLASSLIYIRIRYNPPSELILISFHEAEDCLN